LAVAHMDTQLLWDSFSWELIAPCSCRIGQNQVDKTGEGFCVSSFLSFNLAKKKG
jgi:hypothetical protein